MSYYANKGLFFLPKKHTLVPGSVELTSKHTITISLLWYLEALQLNK